MATEHVEADQRSRMLQDVEEFLGVIAGRYGFRVGDFSLTWDGGQFEPSRDMHELVIEVRDGRRSVAQLSDIAISQKDRWKYVQELDIALKALRRRARGRGS